MLIKSYSCCLENNLIVCRVVAQEFDGRVQPIFFEQYPEYGQLHRQVIAGINALKPTNLSPLEAVTHLGGVVLSFARKVRGVEPFKSNWKEHVWNSKIRLAELRNNPEPFQEWDELVKDYEENWRSQGLTNPTVLPIAERVLTHVDLWTDESIRALVLDHLIDRCGVIFKGIENVRDYFVVRVSQGEMVSAAEAQDFIAIVADNVTGVNGRRPISLMQRPNTLQLPRYKNLATSEDWEKFNNTGVGRKLGLFSTVRTWVEENPGEEISTRMARYRQIRREALANYLKDPEYQEFAANPFETIEQALISFKAGS